MGSLILVSGSNNSGKSLFAEKLVSCTAGERFYVATMIPQMGENHVRIEKHRRQRKGLDFHTLELPYRVGQAAVSEKDVVLLEDVSNLLANVMFEKGGTEKDVFLDILNLLKRCKVLIAVTITELSAGKYDSETIAYINSLNLINKCLFDVATAAVKMQDNTPLWQKGDSNDLF